MIIQYLDKSYSIFNMNILSLYVRVVNVWDEVNF